MSDEQAVTVVQQGGNGLSATLSNPLNIVRMLYKRKLLITEVWSIIAFAGFIGAWLIPPTYRSEAVILIESQRIPERLVPNNVNADVQSRLNTISQFVLSYSRLSEIINRFDLYSAERKRLFHEQVVELMRSHIAIKPAREWNERASSTGPRAFSVSFEGQDPSVVARVTAQLSTHFIDENVKVREDQATSTSAFLDSQLKASKQALEEQEAELSAFKRRYNGELPQQENVLIASLSQVQSQLDSVHDALNRAEQQAVLLRSALDSAEASQAAIVQFSQRSDAIGSASPAAKSPVQARRAAVAEQLLQLRQRYKDEHPDVQMLTSELQALERAETDGKAEPWGNQITPAGLPVRSPEFVQAILRERERVESLRTQISANEKWLTSLQRERAEVLQRLEAVRSRIAGLPVREQELAAVTREYEISKRNYQSLLDKTLSAAMGAEMERRQQSERFTILDPARVPEMPVKPKRELIVGSVAAFGLVFALAVAFLVESRGNTMAGEWEIPAGIPILGRVPDLARRRISPLRMLGWAASACALLVVGLITALYYAGRIRPDAILNRFLQ